MTPMTANDRNILRELARRVAEIAALPAQEETRAAWRALNALRPARPMVYIDQIPWHEMDVDGELANRCADPFCAGLEAGLRQTLYRWRHLPADMVVEPWIGVPKAIRDSGYGLKCDEETSVLDPRNYVVGHYYHDQLKTDEDLAKIKAPEVSLDETETARREALANDIFDGILPVRMQGLFPWCAPWDWIVQWHGVEETLYDLVDRPEFMHRLVGRLTAAFLAMLDSAEAQGLLGSGQSYIHCTGAWTDQLPAPGFDPARPRARDLWTMGMAQIFSSVSREMYDEFEVPYISRIYARFGLGYYGCCDPLDDRIDLVRKIPNVRKISMSPWVDERRGAAAIGGDYVFSRKPSPALFALDTFEGAAAEKQLRVTLAACREHGCPLELILKDLSTVRYDPERLWRWEKIAMRLVEDAAAR